MRRKPKPTAYTEDQGFSLRFLWFFVFAVYFWLLLQTLYPFLTQNFTFHSSVYWYFTGYALFLPMMFVALVPGLRAGASLRAAFSDLGVRPLTSRDWRVVWIGLAIIFCGTGLIMGGSYLLAILLGWPMLNSNPDFLSVSAYVGWERLLILLWLPMFALNIVGEELLWRGHIQSQYRGKHVWLWMGLMWAMFHFPFGWQTMLLTSPAFVVIPYIYQHYPNTSISILIHGLFNGPIFLLILLGIVAI